MNKFYLQAVILNCLFASYLAQGVGFLHASGPLTASISAITCEPQLPQACLAINQGVLYYSSNSGSVWKKSAGVSPGIVQILAHPLTRKLYALQYSQLLVSDDDGKSFHPVFTASSKYLYSFYTLTLASNNPKRIYIGAGGALFYSIDDGQTWKKRSLGGDYQITNIAESPIDRNSLYISAVTPGDYDRDTIPVILTNDGGRTWRKVWQGHSEAYYDCSYRFFVTSFPLRLLAYRCKSSIKVLSPSGIQPFANIPRVSQITAGSGRQLYLLQTDKHEHQSILKSIDGGKHWIRLNGDLLYLRSSIVAFGVTTNSHLLVGTGGGGVYDCDTGLKCSVSNAGFSGSGFCQVIVRTASKLLTVCTANLYDAQSRFLYSSSDEGKHWEDLTVRAKLTDPIGDLIVHPTDPNSVLGYPFSYYDRYFYITHDGGTTWKKFTTSFQTLDLVFDPMNPRTFYALTDLDSGVPMMFKSINDGSSFTHLPKLPLQSEDFPDNLVIDKFQPGVLYLSGDSYPSGGVILKSTDDGRTYERIRFDKLMSFQNWAYLPQPNSFLASTEYGGRIFRTTDGGHTWDKISAIRGGGPVKLYPADTQGIRYYAIANSRLFESDDSAQHWQDITPQNPSFGQGSVYVLSISDPKIHPIYLATDIGIISLSEFIIRTHEHLP